MLTYNNELVDALYSSTTGGVTARFTDVWNGEDRPYLKPVIDSLQGKWDLATKPLSDEANFRAFISLKEGFNEDDWPLFRWNRTATLKEMDEVLKRYLRNRQHPLANYSQLTGITVLERSNSGRVQTLRVETDMGSFELLKDESVKALVPPRSLLFYVEPVMTVPEPKKTEKNTGKDAANEKVEQTAVVPQVGNSEVPAATEESQADADSAEAESAAEQSLEPVLTGFRFVGGGFGHGVGMSQTGAYNLGEKGYSPKQILEFYYPGTELKILSEETVFWNGD